VKSTSVVLFVLELLVPVVMLISLFIS
jgi:hypothetical protein